MTTTTAGLAAARQAHSDRCRQRVIAALEAAVAAGEEISISLISRKANVDRSLLYRHRDLHALVLAQATVPPTLPSTGPSVSRTSLLTDLAAAHDRVARLTRENTQLRARLSETLGQHAWRESGLGAPTTSPTSRPRSSNWISRSPSFVVNSWSAMTSSTRPVPPTAS